MPKPKISPRLQEMKASFRQTEPMAPLFHPEAVMPPHTAPSMPEPMTSLDYQVGDMVRHIKFGVGKVTGIVQGGRDYEVTVNFDKFGTKKMFAGFAKLVKIS